MKRAGSNVSLKIPTKGLSKSWRYKKTDLPAPGSYDVFTASTHQSNMPSEPKYKFSNTENKRFTTIICEQKAFVPGAGYYDIEKCFKAKARPNSANRRRRI